MSKTQSCGANVALPTSQHHKPENQNAAHGCLHPSIITQSCGAASELHKPKKRPRMVAGTVQDTVLWRKCLHCPPASTTSTTNQKLMVACTVHYSTLPTRDPDKPKHQNATYGCLHHSVRTQSCGAGVALPTSTHHKPQKSNATHGCLLVQGTVLWCKCLPSCTTSEKIKMQLMVICTVLRFWTQSCGANVCNTFFIADQSAPQTPKSNTTYGCQNRSAHSLVTVFGDFVALPTDEPHKPQNQHATVASPVQDTVLWHSCWRDFLHCPPVSFKPHKKKFHTAPFSTQSRGTSVCKTFWSCGTRVCKMLCTARR